VEIPRVSIGRKTYDILLKKMNKIIIIIINIEGPNI